MNKREVLRSILSLSKNVSTRPGREAASLVASDCRSQPSKASGRLRRAAPPHGGGGRRCEAKISAAAAAAARSGSVGSSLGQWPRLLVSPPLALWHPPLVAEETLVLHSGNRRRDPTLRHERRRRVNPPVGRGVGPLPLCPGGLGKVCDPPGRAPAAVEDTLLDARRSPPQQEMSLLRLVLLEEA